MVSHRIDSKVKMKLKSKFLLSFLLVICLPIFAGGVNIFFFLKINRSIDELVENRFAVEQKVQSGHLIINKIYNKIWDTLLLDVNHRSEHIRDLDQLATTFYQSMDAISDYLSYPSGSIRNQKRYFQTFYIAGKDILMLNNLADFQENEEKIKRFRLYKERLVNQIDTRFEGYKNEFANSLSDLQKNTYVIAGFSIFSIILGSLLAAAFSIQLSTNLVRPIIALTHVIRNYVPGKKQIPANERTRDEIGRLGAAFNEMTRQLNESVENLEAQIVETREAEKKAALRRKQLVQADKMASLGILVSGVAHEINNPNQFIMSHIEPLKNAWEGAIPVLDQYSDQYGDFRMGGANYSLIKKKIPNIFSNISKGSLRIKTIVDELRGFVNESPRDILSKVNLNNMVDSALTLTANMIDSHTDNFSFQRGGNIPLIPGHYQRLEQVIVNLVQNACQALESKQETIRIKTGLDETENNALIEVMDTGIGIMKQDMDHVTDPFFTTKREQGGTGLGLSISSRIIADHHGTMVFESEKQKGTTVVIQLPLFDREVKE